MVFMNWMNIFLLLLTFSSLGCCQSGSWLPKIVWTYWEEPLTDKDHFLISFSNNHKKMLKGWEIRHMNRNNMWDWLNEISGLKEKFYSDQFLSQADAKRADLIRLAIMHHYGGVWMDFTMILTENLDWILDLKNNDLVQNKYGDHPDIFILYSSEHGDKDKAFDKETNQNFMLYPTFEIFFMAAKPGNQFAKDWLNFYVQTIYKSFKNYGPESGKAWVVEYAKLNNLKRGGFADFMQSYFECSVSSTVLLQEKQTQLDKIQNKQSRELVVKNYNIWIMGTGSTAYLLNSMGDDDIKSTIQILAQTDIGYLKKKKYFPKYFFKVFHQMYFLIRLFFMNSQMKNSLDCPQMYYILENSILYRYLLQNSTVKFYQNQIKNTSYNRNCLLPVQLKKCLKASEQLDQLKQGQGINQEQIKNILNEETKKLLETRQESLFQRIVAITQKKQDQSGQLYKQIEQQQKLQYQNKIASQEKQILQLKEQNDRLFDVIKMTLIGLGGCFVILVFVICACIRQYKLSKKQNKKKQLVDQPQAKIFYDSS